VDVTKPKIETEEEITTTTEVHVTQVTQPIKEEVTVEEKTVV